MTKEIDKEKIDPDLVKRAGKLFDLLDMNSPKSRLFYVNEIARFAQEVRNDALLNGETKRRYQKLAGKFLGELETERKLGDELAINLNQISTWECCCFDDGIDTGCSCLEMIADLSHKALTAHREARKNLTTNEKEKT